MLDGKPGETHDVGPVKRLPAQPPRDELDAPSTKAEGGLASDAGVIKDQARQVQPLNDGENLLKVASGTALTDKKPRNQSNHGKEPGK
ncbi:MAG: hypothetical protein WD468_12705 [Pirellulales bacterium]